MKKELYYDTVIAGCGVSGLFTALHLPPQQKILIICKEDMKSCNSMLAQGGICVLVDDADYESYFEDTMRAGHYENRRESVEIMIRSSRDLINQLVGYGVEFARRRDGSLAYTREGAHSRPRICYHEDITGREITTKLRQALEKLPNVHIMEYTRMQDILVDNDVCTGLVAQTRRGDILRLHAHDTVMATGGIGGRYEHSTNFSCLTGDALDIAHRHRIQLEHLDYVQIHPTALYSEAPGRRFLISESARGEGAVLLNGKGERFVDELLPRDVVTQAILQEMHREDSHHVWLSFAAIPEHKLHLHFPNIDAACREAGYDITRQPIPVVPAQHYFMGGIHVDSCSQTTMKHLYAVGETSCNGVHGKNRLASNSLLESMVFAQRAAEHIKKTSREALQ